MWFSTSSRGTQFDFRGIWYHRMSDYKPRSITSAPEKLVESGKYQLGCFNTPTRRANLLDVSSVFPKSVKSLTLREWQAFQIKCPTHFVMIAIYNAKKIALVQFIVFDLTTNKKTKYEKQVSGSSLHVPDTLYNSTASYKSSNWNVEVRHDLSNNKLDIEIDIQGFEDLPSVRANFQGIHDINKYTPMVVCNPFSSDRVMYSHKCMMPVTGELRFGGELTVPFEPSTAQLIIDDHKGYYPYVTTYDWVTGLGVNGEGKLVGFNLTDNQVIDHIRYNENCLWFDGQLHPLPPIKVRRPEGYKGVWHVSDEFDQVKLEFTPVVHTSVLVNYIIIKSKYEGPYGYYSGYIRKADGEKVVIDKMFGMGEDFYLRC